MFITKTKNYRDTRDFDALIRISLSTFLNVDVVLGFTHIDLAFVLQNITTT